MMKYRSFILSSFFLLLVVICSSPTHGKVGDLMPTEVKAEGPVEIEAEDLIYDR